ncbi:MAG: hypothetical protein EXS16_19930 [Gemmataceae bacterium]|nr:hypothetical protein [Gemmataceae bacterium]
MSNHNEGLEAAKPLFKAWSDAASALFESEEFWASPEMVKAKAHSAANERLLDEIFTHANYPNPETTEDWTTLAALLGVMPDPDGSHGMLDYINPIVAELRRRYGSPSVEAVNAWDKLRPFGRKLLKYLMDCEKQESTIANAMKKFGKKISSLDDKKAFSRGIQRTNNDLLEHYKEYEIERLTRTKSIRLTVAVHAQRVAGRVPGTQNVLIERCAEGE